MITSWHSYPSSFNLGHRYLTDLFRGPVLVEEKVDGSQFSFGVFDIEGVEVLRFRSKGCEINAELPEKMFIKAVEYVKSIQARLTMGWTYRCEYLSKPKHNTLAYDRTPKNNLILFDVNTAEEEYLGCMAKEKAAWDIGIECVPQLHSGEVSDIAFFRSFLERTSILGGQKVEGVVIKNYNQFGQDKKILIGKYVSEAFKEVHGGEWKKNNPTSADIILRLSTKYRTPARWAKAVQHLKESGRLTDSPQDIGLLIRELPADILKEHGEEIKEALFEYAWPKIVRGIHAGLPEWYKEELLKKQFEVDLGSPVIQPVAVADSTQLDGMRLG